MAVSQRVDLPDGRTWTVLGGDWQVVKPVEEYLEFLRNTERSPNTVKSYAHALALWWSFLEDADTDWTSVTLSTLGAFQGRLRRGQVTGTVVDLQARPVPETTVAVRVRAVASFYRYHAACSGVPVATQLYERVVGPPGPYRPFLEHVARRAGRTRSRLSTRRPRRPTPLLTPEQVATICEGAATWDQARRCWVGNLRNRLLWMLLAETGLRLGEALSLQHGDWTSGHGETSYVEVVPRPHPLGIQQKSGSRRVYIGSELDRLYGDYLWLLCDAGVDLVVGNLDESYIFCNLEREPRFRPMRPETVYDHVAALKRRYPQLPAGWTPHWFRHTHATALLFAGVEPILVSRRLGHTDVQTTINTYAHVTSDSELRALANWRAWVDGWGVTAATD